MIKHEDDLLTKLEGELAEHLSQGADGAKLVTNMISTMISFVSRKDAIVRARYVANTLLPVVGRAPWQAVVNETSVALCRTLVEGYVATKDKQEAEYWAELLVERCVDGKSEDDTYGPLKSRFLDPEKVASLITADARRTSSFLSQAASAAYHGAARNRWFVRTLAQRLSN